MKKRIFMTAAVALITAVSAFAKDFITDIILIGGSEDEVSVLKEEYTSKGWALVDKDLNKNCGIHTDYIYLLYKKGSDQVDNKFITDFYISSNSSASSLTHNGRTYYLASYEGGSHFKKIKGDLNSNAGGDDIHLYYTKDKFSDNRAVSGISFNDKKDGAVGENGGSTGYDLNSGAHGDYIYMHFTTGTAAVFPSLPGNGSQSDPFVISNAADWSTFAKIINGGRHLDRYYLISNSFDNSASPVTEAVGTPENPFKGHFNGNNRTLYVNINGDQEGTAPFWNVSGATIENLTIEGNVTSDKHHTAGLVGKCIGSLTLIDSCVVNANISSPTYAGGIVGHGGHDMLVITNSVFGGRITDFDKFAGGLVGWCDDLELNIINCLFKGSFSARNSGSCHPIACKYGPCKVNANVASAFYLDNITPTVSSPNLIIGADGIRVNGTLSDGMDIEVVAADGKTYYAESRKATELDGIDMLQDMINVYHGLNVTPKVEYVLRQGMIYGICLPFAITSVENGTLYKLSGAELTETGGEKLWVLTMNDVTPDQGRFQSTDAGMPYLFVSDITGSVVFSGQTTIPEYKTGFPLLEADATNGFKMRGTYKNFATDRSYGNVYSLLMVSTSHDQFTERTYYYQINQKEGIESMHSYLVYEPEGDEEIPQVVKIRLLAKDGTDTAVGTVNIQTGEITIDTWYNLNGQRLNIAPDAPGIYIHNGRKVYIGD